MSTDAATNHQPSDIVASSHSTDPIVRWYERGDAEEFRSLYETVWGTRKGRVWFDWRFRDNPASEGVEMVVAEADGQLVGAEPVVPYRVRVGDDGQRLEARQPVDWIVHPEYRRMGIFGAMTERLLAGLGGDAALVFNFPNEALWPGIEARGWRIVDTVSARYRVQDPSAALEMGSSPTTGAVAAAAARVGSPILGVGLGVLDRVGSFSQTVTVDRVPGVPVETIGSLYASNVPDRIHVPRTRSFLEWRFANPRWNVESYVAERDGDAVATSVVASESIGGHGLVRLLDVQPMTDAVEEEAFEAMLRAIVTTHADAAVIKLPADRFPRVCRRYGFVRDDGFPASRLSSTTYHAVRPLDPAAVPAADRSTDGSNADGSRDSPAWNGGSREPTDRGISPSPGTGCSHRRTWTSADGCHVDRSGPVNR